MNTSIPESVRETLSQHSHLVVVTLELKSTWDTKHLSSHDSASIIVNHSSGQQ